VTESLYDSVNFVIDTVGNADPQSVILSVAGALVTGAAYMGVRVTPRLALALGSALYAGCRLAGWAGRRELSPAAEAALDALDDNAAVYEERFTEQFGTWANLLTCTGLTVRFHPDGEVYTIDAGDTKLSAVLPGGAKGREYRRVAAKAQKVRDVVRERDRQAANEAAARAVEQAKARANAASAGYELAANGPAGSVAWAKSAPANVPLPKCKKA